MQFSIRVPFESELASRVVNGGNQFFAPKEWDWVATFPSQSTSPFETIHSFLFLPIPFYSLLFLSIPFYSFLFLAIPFYSLLFLAIPFYSLLLLAITRPLACKIEATDPKREGIGHPVMIFSARMIGTDVVAGFWDTLKYI